MADAIVGTCVTSCDYSVAGADKGNFRDTSNTIDTALIRGESDRVFARVDHATPRIDFYDTTTIGDSIDELYDSGCSAGRTRNHQARIEELRV